VIHHRQLRDAVFLADLQAVFHGVVGVDGGRIAHHEVLDLELGGEEIQFVGVLRAQREVGGAQAVGAGDEAAQAAAVDHRQAMQVVFGEDALGFGQQRVAADHHRIGLHPVSDDHAGFS
jgi:hypothetical protein